MILKFANGCGTVSVDFMQQNGIISLSTGKNKIASVNFVDQTTCMHYISDMEMVKGTIADIDADFEAKVVTKSERDERYLSWFLLCRVSERSGVANWC